MDLEGVAEIRGGTVCQSLGVCYLWKHSEPLLPLLQVPPRLEPNAVVEDLNTFLRERKPLACMWVCGWSLQKGRGQSPGVKWHLVGKTRL